MTIETVSRMDYIHFGMEAYKTYEHNPPHLFRENGIYFITASTYGKLHHLTDTIVKTFLRDSIFKAFCEAGWEVTDWVILDNHYHLLVKATEHPEQMSEIIRAIHRYSAIYIRKNGFAEKSADQIWYNYWDRCVNTLKDFYTIAHYIWHNPVKHGYVTGPFLWEFGSFRTRFVSEPDYCTKMMSEYPLDNFKYRDDF